MAKTPTRSEQESYRLPFFIIANLIMGSMLWLVFQETFTRRPWKDYQLNWFEMEKARANKNLESARAWVKDGTLTTVVDGEEKKIKVGERAQALRAKIAELEGDIVDTPKRVEYLKIKQDLGKAEVELKDAEIRLAFAKADEDEYYYYYRDAKHHGGGPNEEKFKKRYEELHAAVLKRSDEYDQATAKRDGLSDAIGKYEAELLKAKKELAELEDSVAAAQRAVDATKERYTGIEQFWNQQIDLVDRCHTCHVGFDKCGYTNPKEIVDTIIAEKLDEAATVRRFCVTREEAGRYVAGATKIVDSWGSEELGFEQIKADLKLEEDPLFATAAKLKMAPEVATQLFGTHPHEAGLMRAHPSQTYGCTTCHYGQGRQTKGVGLNLLIGETAPFDHARRDHYWQSQILETKTGQVEASCFNCHSADYELPYAPRLTEGRKLVQHLGCTGCHPLGPLDPERKHGPSLAKVASKIDQGWMLSWIQHPRALRPRTRMPSFWPSALKDGKPDPTALRCDEFDYSKGAPFAPAVYKSCLEVRDEESAFMMAYILEKSASPTYPTMPASASADRGKQVFEQIGCRGCHNLGEWQSASHMPGSVDRDLAPNLDGVGDKITSPGWFYEWVRNPKAYWHETRMPRLRLTDDEAWDVAAYLSSLKTGKTYGVPEKIKTLMGSEGASDKGRRLLAYYGCFGCHEISGFETLARVGADLTEFGSKQPSKLDFGDVPEFTGDPHSQTWQAWIEKKLTDPRVFRYERAASRMPQFDVSQREMELAVLFLKSQNDQVKTWPEQIKKRHSAAEGAKQRGALLVDFYNCRGCHLIDDRGVDLDKDHVLDGGDILASMPEDERFRAPPKLIRQGAKVYPDWFFSFLKAPFKLRENYKVRMPTFQLSDADASDIVAYFAAKAKTPYPFVEKKRDVLSAADQAVAEKLFAEAQCTNCHNLGGSAPIDPKNVAPNLRLTAERLQYDWLFHWLKNPQEQAPGVGMPNFFAAVDDKPGEYETPLPELANGDWKRQIELLRAFVINLGHEKAAAPEQRAEAPRPPRRRAR